jgi:hypothetical protein
LLGVEFAPTVSRSTVAQVLIVVDAIVLVIDGQLLKRPAEWRQSEIVVPVKLSTW